MTTLTPEEKRENEAICEHKFPNIYWDYKKDIDKYYSWVELGPTLELLQKYRDEYGEKFEGDAEELFESFIWDGLARKMPKNDYFSKLVPKLSEEIKELSDYSDDFTEKAQKTTKLKDEEIMYLLYRLWSNIELPGLSDSINPKALNGDLERLLKKYKKN